MTDNKKGTTLFHLLLLSVFLVCLCLAPTPASAKLSFGVDGEFKILQVADMHYGNGATTGCQNILPSQEPCSDLNTTAFMSRVIAAEKPDLIVFTGDNIYGPDTRDAVKSMDAAFAPAIASKVPWVAVLGNHDSQSTLSRQEVMKYIVTLPNTLSQVNPPEAADYIDGFGNYNLEIHGAADSSLQNKSVLNLYFLDSGDRTTVPLKIRGYDWIKASQQSWYERTSKRLQSEYNAEPNPQFGKAPGLAFFHIPLPEFWSFDSKNATTGERQEDPCSPSTNSGFFTTLVARGDVKSVFVGHDHVNDFCGKLVELNLCYSGGFGYHAYGKVGWERRARVVVVNLNKEENGSWGDVKSIETWKRLDDQDLSVIDDQRLWYKWWQSRSDL